VPRIYSSTLANIRYVRRNFCKRCRKILSSVGFELGSPTRRQRYYCHFDTLLLHSASQEMVRRGSCLALCCCAASSCERIVDSYSISQSKQQRITSTNNKNIGCLLCMSDFFLPAWLQLQLKTRVPPLPHFCQYLLSKIPGN
jgi:hypothetical protein